MKSIIAAAVLAAMSVVGAAHATTHVPATGVHAPSALADGEVRRVDKEAKKITIRHGPIASLDMPPMTMVFQVSDTNMLDAVKAGDKIRFQADRIGGAYTVTQLETAQ